MSPTSSSKTWSDPLEQLTAEGALPVDRFVTFKVNQLSTAFERQWTRFMHEKAGVNLSQWRILAILRGGPATFARVVEMTGMNKALMTRSTRELQALRLLAITDTPGDARSITLSLAAKGERVLSQVLPLALERQRRLLSSLTPAERRVFYAAIDKLHLAALDWDSGSEDKRQKSALIGRLPRP